MAVLVGGGLFLMSEVPLYTGLYPKRSVEALQGYLAHKKHSLP